jgi:hypothetical protein
MTHNRGASYLALPSHWHPRVQEHVLDQKMLVVESALPEAEVAVREKQLSGSAFGIVNANRRLANTSTTKGQISHPNTNLLNSSSTPRKTALALIHMRNAVVGMKTEPHSATQVVETRKILSKPPAPTVRPLFMSAYRSDAKASALLWPRTVLERIPATSIPFAFSALNRGLRVLTSG